MGEQAEERCGELRELGQQTKGDRHLVEGDERAVLVRNADAAAAAAAAT
jgi:hypothetical protein